MLQTKIERELKNKEKLVIKVLTPLEHEHSETIVQLLCEELFAGDEFPWVPDVRRRLSGEFMDWSKDYFFLGKINNEVIAHAWYTVGTAKSFMMNMKDKYER